jgi:membrane protease YdiL (CAAX protease family)
VPDRVTPEPEDSRNREDLEMPVPEPRPPEEWTDEPSETDFPEPPLDEQPATLQPFDAIDANVRQDAQPAGEQLPFLAYTRPEFPPFQRIPNFGHLLLFGLLFFIGWFVSGLFVLAALRAHLFGISSLKLAVTDFRYSLASQAMQYFVTLAGCLVVFPLVWRKGFFAGLQWRGKTALEHSGRLVSAAMMCFVLAIVNGYLMPGPSDAPIDRIFRVPGAAWVLFAFGVTLAPFFEELAFRGFLLPSLCTAYDWVTERATGMAPRPLDEYGHPQWSLPAMIVASILTSIPFALMHGEQTSYSLGPFLLLVGVSLVLCWARLGSRSLAASVMVHACYNFILFTFMMWGTGGFKHLENM